MSKPWKPGKQTVELRPSRIRREPVRAEVKVRPRSRERELWTAAAGILLFALASIALVLGLTDVWRQRIDDAGTPRFGQCYNAGGQDCVLDGDTVYLGGQRVDIAGMVAPRIQDAACDAERVRGIDSAVRLVDLLNSGAVTLAHSQREPDGELRRHVEVNGRDVGVAMVDEGAAHEPRSEPINWCNQEE